MATYTLTTLNFATPLDDAGGVAAPATGDKFPNDGLTFLYVRNTSGSASTITFSTAVSTANPTGLGPVTIASTDLTVSVAAGKSMLIGPFGPSRFNDTGGLITVTYSTASAFNNGVRVVRLVPIA
ncbi:MAG: hypothetical protein HY299_23025 [Verrucomicrobia bacterium]|nr:hypothetical protein [Verrucomicrobiota bacterium]